MNSSEVIFDFWQTGDFIEPSGDTWVSLSEIFTQHESKQRHKDGIIKDVDTSNIISHQELVSLKIIVNDSSHSQKVLFVILKGYCIEWTVSQKWIINLASILRQLALEEIAPLIDETILI